MRLLAAHLEEHARRRPDHAALVLDDGRLSYGALLDGVRRADGWLDALGVGRGDRVALRLPKGLAFVLLHLANQRRGSVTVPVNDQATPDEVRYLLEDSGACRLVCAADADDARRACDGLAAEPVPVAPQHDFAEASPREETAPPTATDLACLCYTSGTTGRPKGAMLTHGGLAANADALHEAWAWSGDDVLLHVLPLFHVHGLFVALHGALRAGATTVLRARFDATQAWRWLADSRATLFMGVPTMYHRLVEAFPDAPPDLSRLRLFVSGSAPLRADTARRFTELTGHAILERYGMTEVGMATSQTLDGPRRPGTVGVPLPGVEVRVVDRESGDVVAPGDVGEVHIRGSSVFAGYWGREDATRAAFADDSWLRSGDLGRLDDDGELHLVGRATELVISGGFNVYPKEVEAALDAHPDVLESAVAGVPDDDFGERVVAGVVRRDDATVSAEQLSAWCRERLAPYKCPKQIAFLAALPRNAMGKVQKARLAELPELYRST